MSTDQEAAAQSGRPRNLDENPYVVARRNLDCPYDLKDNGNPRVDYHDFVMTCTGALVENLLIIKERNELGGKKRTVNFEGVKLRFIIHGVWGGQIWIEIDDKGSERLHYRSLKNRKECHFKFADLDNAAFKTLDKKGLSTYWPDITKEDNKLNYCFIHKEWNAHSICSDMIPKEFYDMALHVVSNHLDLEAALAEKDILPDDEVGYPASHIRAALKEKFGADMAIGWCTMHNKKYLFDIRARVEWKEGTIIDGSYVPKFMDHNQVYICLDKRGEGVPPTELNDTDLLIFKGINYK